jgi:serine/threonine-protein kinase
MVVLLAGPSGFAPDFSDAKPPRVLAERARQIVEDLGYTAAPTHEAFGFAYWPAVDFLTRSAGAERSRNTKFATPNQAGFKFWYRRSPTLLAPLHPLNITFRRARTTLTDPPRAAPGMITLILDAGGRLLGFEALPSYSTTRQRSGATSDSSTLFAAAGLESAEHTADAPALPPPAWGVEQLAWIPREPAAVSTPRRIEAATLRGHPVFFAVLEDVPDSAGTARHRDTARRRATGMNARIVLLTVAALGAIPLARLNLRRGQGDRQGALRLAGFVLAARLAVWGLGAAHAAQLRAELVLLLFAILGALFESGLVWLFYIALEPFVRRLWPQTIVAWNRILANRWRDPLVARDLLIGMLLGVVLALIFELDWLVLGWIGWEARDPLRLTNALEPLLGARHAVAECGRSALAALYLSLYLVTMLVITRVLLKRTWLAGVVTIVATAPVYLPQMSHPGISWIPLGIVLALAVWAATRHGLVVVASATFVSRLLLALPLDFRPATWGWDVALLVLLLTVGIAVYALVFARRRAVPAVPEPL